MHYNTQTSPVRMKAYGRGVQALVERALTIEDRAERTAFAARIVETMRIVTRQPAGSREVNEKLWNHLARLSDYGLDIDWPVAIDRGRPEQHPERLPYPGGRLRFRHYGRLFETWLSALEAETEPARRAAHLRELAARMRRNLTETRGGAVDAERLAKDIEFYTDGNIAAPEVLRALSSD